MNKLNTILLLAALSAPAFANANDAATEEASVGYIQSVLVACKEYAVEDEVDADSLNDYLLQCVNDDLEENEFKKIAELPSI